jgi:hypothetical protein
MIVILLFLSFLSSWPAAAVPHIISAKGVLRLRGEIVLPQMPNSEL